MKTPKITVKFLRGTALSLVITGLMLTFMGCGSLSALQEYIQPQTKEREIATLAPVDETAATDSVETSYESAETFDASLIPDYSDTDVITVNNDEPYFMDEEKEFNGTYINLSELDSLGRCGVATACVGQETEPSEKRGDISNVYPTGWVQAKYEDYLYNRSHLLMFALTGLNDDERNLITGTEYFNQTLMLGYETMITRVVDNYNAHVVYRVTPVFDGDNLVAKGVLMEAYCIEYPEECTFCVFVYNVADPSWNVTIDYATGKNWKN